MSIRHKMRKTWTHDDIMMLLSLWNDYEKKLRTLKRNSHIYDKLAALLRSRGVDATSTEVHFKINNLKQKYRKDELYGVTSWRYFEHVREILQYSKNSNQSTMNQECRQNTSNNYLIKAFNDSTVKLPQIPAKTCNTPLVSKLPSPSMPKTSSCTPIPHAFSSNLLYKRNFPQLSTGNENHSKTSVSNCLRKKTSLKRALLEEIRRGNDIAARDQEITERLLRQANEINQEWNRIMKEFMSRTLTILEKNFTLQQNCNIA